MDAGAANSSAMESGTAASSASAPITSGAADPPYFKLVKTVFFFMNIGLMVFLAAVGALGMGSSTSINDTGLIFVGLYLIIFAGLVFFYELAQVLNWESLDLFMKKNFGFLYGVYGKSLFILM